MQQEIGEERVWVTRAREKPVMPSVNSLNDVNDIVRKLAERSLAWPLELLDYLSPMFEWIGFVNDDPVMIAAAALKKTRNTSKNSARWRVMPRGIISSRLRRIFRQRGLFDSDIPIISTQDAIHIGFYKHPEAFILDVTSVREEALKRFVKFLSGFPEINEGLRRIVSKTEYSSRVVFDPYPAAVSAWIEGRLAAEYFPTYMLQYLNAAIRYYHAKEWRTSIVLSAIALETLLAEMFEDEFHEQAGDVPLGALRDKIVESFKLGNRGPAFPNEILESIGKTNDARVAAVHRGSIQLSARETMEALRGSVKVALWYYYRDIMS